MTATCIRIRLAVILLALCCRFPALAGESPFNWRLSGRDAVLSVALDAYIYADSVRFRSGGKQLDATLPASTVHDDPFSGKTQVYAGGGHRFILPEGTSAAGLKVEYQGCSGNLCLAPTVFEFAPAAAGSVEHADRASEAELLPQVEFRRFDGVSSERELAEFLTDGKSVAATSERGNPVWALLGVLLGGMLLNLTPCVLPLIPLNLAFIGAGDRSNAGAGFRRGLLYGAGMTAAYGLLGVAVLGGGASFGALSSNWIFNYGVGALFLVLAMAMLGAFNLDLSRFQGRFNIGAKWASGIGIAALGMVAALLAGTCVAPVVIGVLVWAAALQAEGVVWAWGLPFVLGLGMALPWPIAGAGIGIMPKAGAWTRFVKWGFGLLILGMAGYYIYTGTGLLLRDKSAGADETIRLENAFARSRQEEKPLLVDFWASWCSNCRTLDKQMQSPQIKPLLERFIVVKYNAEDLNDPATRQVLDRFGIKGLPALVAIENSGE